MDDGTVECSEAVSLADVIEISPVALAAALTAVSADMASSLEESEFDNLAWSRKDKAEKAPNLIAMISQFNQLSNLVASSVLQAGVESHCAMAPVIGHWVATCTSLEQDFCNYNDAMSVLAGLMMSEVYRLTAAWAETPSAVVAEFERLKTLMAATRNYSELRPVMAERCVGGGLAYIGVFLTDLTFIHDGSSPNPERVAEHSAKVVNEMRDVVFGAGEGLDDRMSAALGAEMEEFDLAATIGLVTAMIREASETSEDVIYEQSLQVEPRNDASRGCPNFKQPA